MKSFNEYREERFNQELVETIHQAGINTDDIIDYILTICENKDLSEEQLFNELIGGLSNLAGAGLGAVGRGIGNVANQAWQGAKQVGSAVGGAVQQGANAVGGAMQQAGQGIANTYMQGENQRGLQKLQSQIQTVKQTLAQMGFKSQQANDFLDKLVRTV